MDSDSLLLDISTNGIATLTLNRPEKHNAFDDNLIAQMTQQLQKLNQDKSIRAVILAANGKSFSAGADLNWMQRMAEYDEQQNTEDALALADLMRTLNTLSKPTIAIAQGAAFGGGVGLVACCDIAIASSNALFCFSEVKLGLIPAVISPYVIAAIGERACRRYFLTAERFNAEQALMVGLIHQVCHEDEIELLRDQIIKHLLKNGPQAIAASKQLIQQISQRPIDENMIQSTAQQIAKIRVSAEGQEGLKAFLEKRRAAWQQ